MDDEGLTEEGRYLTHALIHPWQRLGQPSCFPAIRFVADAPGKLQHVRHVPAALFRWEKMEGIRRHVRAS